MATPGPERAPTWVPTLSALLEDLAAAPSAPIAPLAVSPGTVVGGRFQVVRELGRGGFGVVVEAMDTTLGRPVALKFVRPGLAIDASATPALAEAEAISRLSHPNILHIHDRGTGDAGPFLVLELLEGESLARRLERGAVELHEAVRIALAVARGIAHAHVRGVVHRDLKPSNVFLCSDGQVKVLDFGLAHLCGRPVRFEGGTPGWLAPEQVRGAVEDERTDVWALGALLFRMLAGADPSTSRLHVPAAPDLEALVEAMVSTDPGHRPRDAGHVVEALEPVARRLEARMSAVPGAAAAGAGRPSGAPGAEGAGPSVAVLPFVNDSSDPEQEFFSDGVAEEILNGLSQVEGLRVTGRTSSFAMKGRVDDLPTIARRLGVAHLIEGSVRKAGVRVRITARLVEAAGGTQLWSQAFGGDLGDVFEVQERIARAVAAALEVRLLGSGRTEGRTRVPEAHDQYLLGISAFARGSNEGEVRAVAAFRRAVELDPGYAPAWARLATALYRASGDASQNPAVGFPAAEAAAEKAIALAPDLADGWAARAELRQAIRYDWAGARADYERARALEPGASATLFRYGSLLLALGRTAEAISALREATALDPLSAEVATDLAMAYLQDGQLARAEATAERALELSPEHARAARTLGFALLLQGQLPGAQRAFRRSSHGFFVLMGDAMVEHSLGHPAESERAVAGLLGWPEAENGAWQIAQVHAWRGEPDQAFEWLRAAVRLRDPGLDQLKGDPVLRPLHGDPRFAEVLRAVNLPG